MIVEGGGGISWKAEVISACASGISRLTKDLVALEYSERRVASALAVELEPAPGLAPEVEVVVEDMGGRVSHVPRLAIITDPRWRVIGAFRSTSVRTAHVRRSSRCQSDQLSIRSSN